MSEESAIPFDEFVRRATWPPGQSYPAQVVERQFYYEKLWAITAPQALLSECHYLRRLLAPGSERREPVAVEAPAILRELWAAMRRIGGAVPRPPEILKRFKEQDHTRLLVASFRGQICDLIDPEEVLQAVDEVVTWCDEQREVAEQLPPSQVREAEAATETERKFMEMAIEEARKSAGADGRAQPKVGALVVRDGIVLASGHRGELREGEHAE